jgi:DNA-binding transcriptional LysR family regulator
MRRRRGRAQRGRQACASLRSFTASGKPCIQPAFAARQLRVARIRLGQQRSVSRSETIALCSGFSAAMRSRLACISSRQDTSRAAMRRDSVGPIKSRLIALNVHDAVLRLVEGSCDLLIAYHHPSQPLQLDNNKYEMVSLGEETVAPWVKADADGAPRFRLPGRPGQPLPYLGYAPGAYLGRVVDQLLKESGTAIHLDRVYETDMAEGLKVMALEGHGIAFLPQSAVRKEIKARKLVSALPPEIDSLEATMEIRAYRERPSAPAPVKTGNGRSAKVAAVSEGIQPKRTADALWSYLVGTQPATR